MDEFYFLVERSIDVAVFERKYLFNMYQHLKFNKLGDVMLESS